MILGYDSADKREIALDLLAKEGIKFTMILDPSMAAQMMAMQTYRVNAVPTTYVIDREGKIADAWVGFEAETPGQPSKAAALLKKLGIE